MATTAPPSAPPMPVAAPIVIAPTIPPARGWLTSEHLLTVLAVFVNALLAANVLPASSEAVRITMMIATTLGALGYGAMRTSAKNTAAKGAANDNAAAIAGLVTGSLSRVALGLLFVLTSLAVGSQLTGCKSAGTLGAGSGSGSGLAACSLANLEQAVGNKTLLGTVAADLISGDYEAALAALAATVGLDEVNCAVLAFDDLESALGVGSGSAAAAKALSPALANARAYEARHGLR